MQTRTNHHLMSRALLALAAMGSLVLLIGRCLRSVVGIRPSRGPRLAGVVYGKADTDMVGQAKALLFAKKTGSSQTARAHLSEYGALFGLRDQA